jgi:uncharacterized protein YdhG (YjbR/CyaY superfamily)
MKAEAPRLPNVDAYIDGYPKNVQKLLKQVRAAIRKAAPDAEELISYNMPAYKYHGVLAYFAAHTSHIGLYPMASTIERFKKEIVAFKHAKGSIQFPFDKPMPVDLIGKMIASRAKANREKAEIKAKLKKPKP